MNIPQKIEDYIAFLRYALSATLPRPAAAGRIRWQELLGFAQKQCITGVCWQGIRRCFEGSGASTDNKPTDDDVLEWLAQVQNIERQNQQVNDAVCQTCENFAAEGFACCVLKGQGNSLLYPQPLLRVAGDIDVWVATQAFCQDEKKTPEGWKADRAAVLRYCRGLVPTAKAVYHHVDFRTVGGTEVEVHYRPSWMNAPLRNRRLQAYFLKEMRRQMTHTLPMDGELLKSGRKDRSITAPTPDFNIIYQLCHLCRHLGAEGIGLRQVIDYYYLLRSRRLTAAEKQTFAAAFSRYGLLPMAQGIGWILQTVLGLDAEYLVVSGKEKYGKVIFNEIIAGGNFGQYDERALGGRQTDPLRHNLQRLWRDLRLVAYFPAECLWEPLFRLWHYGWRFVHRP